MMRCEGNNAQKRWRDLKTRGFTWTGAAHGWQWMRGVPRIFAWWRSM